MENISKHISYKEATRSLTAIRLGLENKPNEYELSNMIGVAENIFEPLREWVNDPIKVNSFFRSIELNEAIGGSARSQHCQGRAIDIDDTYGHATNAEMFHWVKENLNFDQMIWEFGTDENPDWVHISWVSEDQNRNRCLRAERIDGKTTYRII